MIREWQGEDLNAILSLLNQLNESLGEEQELNIENIKRQYESMASQKTIYHNAVFEKEGIIFGFISIVFYQSIYHKLGTALINELIVAKKYRNQKIGKALLDYAIEIAKARNMDEIEIGVMKENSEAIRFYKSNGINEEYLLLGLEF